MKRFGDVFVTKEIENHIISKMTAKNEPYVFLIKGTPSARCNTIESARRAFEKIKVWAETNFAEVTLIEDEFKKTGRGSNVSGMRLVVKITDPAAYAIEQLLEGGK